MVGSCVGDKGLVALWAGGDWFRAPAGAALPAGAAHLPGGRELQIAGAGEHPGGPVQVDDSEEEGSP